MQTSINHRRRHPFFKGAIRGLALSLALGLALPAEVYPEQAPTVTRSLSRRTLRTQSGLESTTQSNLERNLVGEDSSAGLEEGSTRREWMIRVGMALAGAAVGYWAGSRDRAADQVEEDRNGILSEAGRVLWELSRHATSTDIQKSLPMWMKHCFDKP